MLGFPGDAVVKNPLPMQEMQVQSLGQEDSPGGGNGNWRILQYSCLENSMDRESLAGYKDLQSKI